MAQDQSTTATAATTTVPPVATEDLASRLASFNQELAGDLQINLEGPVE